MRAGGLKTNTHKKTKGVVSCPRGRIVLSQQECTVSSSDVCDSFSNNKFEAWTMFNVFSEYTFAKLLEDVELRLGSNSTVATCSQSATKDCMPSQRVAVDLSFYVV